MKHLSVPGLFAASLYLGLVAPLQAADPVVPPGGAPSAANNTAAKPAEQCLADIRAFDREIEKDGSWLSTSSYALGYGYGYPMSGYPATVTGYHNVRPGHEVRTLIAAAGILGRQGLQQQCEDVLTSGQTIYKRYMADLVNAKAPMVDVTSWRQKEIAAARPVTDNDAEFRSDELIGTEVRDPQGKTLGKVADLVLAPATGKLAYLVIGRGGLFGIDEKFIPIPWSDFKITPTGIMLVLNTSESALDTAPWGHQDQFDTPTSFDLQGKKVDAYWSTHLTANGGY
jgi:sporulation protein YlmC with PRC-barrel domain